MRANDLVKMAFLLAMPALVASPAWAQSQPAIQLEGNALSLGATPHTNPPAAGGTNGVVIRAQDADTALVDGDLTVSGTLNFKFPPISVDSSMLNDVCLPSGTKVARVKGFGLDDQLLNNAGSTVDLDDASLSAITDINAVKDRVYLGRIIQGSGMPVKPILISCTLARASNGNNVYQWKEVAASAQYETTLNHREFYELGDAVYFTGSDLTTRTGNLNTGKEGTPLPPDFWTVFEPTFDRNAVFTALPASTTLSRSMNQWYYNDTNRPLYVSITVSDHEAGTNRYLAIHAKDNYSMATQRAAGPARLLSQMRSRDNNGMYPMTALIPVGAVYSFSMRDDGKPSALEFWSEYNPF